MKTFGEIAKELIGDKASYDHAIPQDWAYEVKEKTGIYPVGHVIWLYDKRARLFGRPFALTYKGFLTLHLMGMEYEDILT